MQRKQFKSHEERIAIIYEHQVHGLSIRRISMNTKLNYSTVFNIIKTFVKEGHTNRLRNFKEKMSLLKFRRTGKGANRKHRDHKPASCKSEETAETTAPSTSKPHRPAHCNLHICEFDESDGTYKPSLKLGSGQERQTVGFNETNFADTDTSVELLDYRFGKEEDTIETAETDAAEQGSVILSTLCRFGDIKNTIKDK